MTPADMRVEALTRVAESDRLFEALQSTDTRDGDLTEDQKHIHRAVAHLRQTAIVFATLSREDS